MALCMKASSDWDLSYSFPSPFKSRWGFPVSLSNIAYMIITPIGKRSCKILGGKLVCVCVCVCAPMFLTWVEIWFVFFPVLKLCLPGAMESMDYSPKCKPHLSPSNSQSIWKKNKYYLNTDRSARYRQGSVLKPFNVSVIWKCGWMGTLLIRSRTGGFPPQIKTLHL